MNRAQSEQNQRIKTGNWNEKFIEKVGENNQGLVSFPAVHYESYISQCWYSLSYNFIYLQFLLISLKLVVQHILSNK